jgi:hypothetical protein
MKQPAHNRSSRYLEPLRKLVVRPAIKMFQHDQFTVVRIESIQSPLKVVKLLARPTGRSGRIRWQIGGGAPPVAGPLLEAAIPQQRVKPRVKAAGCVECPQMSKRIQKRLLRRIGGVAVIAGEHPGVRERPTLIPPNQMPERVTIPQSASSDGIGIFHNLCPYYLGNARSIHLEQDDR